MAGNNHIACPLELLGIAQQMEQMPPATRAAAVAVVYGAWSSALLLVKSAEAVPALNLNEQQAYDFIKAGGPHTAGEIAKHVCVEEQTVRKWLKRGGRLHTAGVQHKRATGYFISDVD